MVKVDPDHYYCLRTGSLSVVCPSKPKVLPNRLPKPEKISCRQPALLVDVDPDGIFKGDVHVLLLFPTFDPDFDLCFATGICINLAYRIFHLVPIVLFQVLTPSWSSPPICCTLTAPLVSTISSIPDRDTAILSLQSVTCNPTGNGHTCVQGNLLDTAV